MLSPHEQQNLKKYTQNIDVTNMTGAFDALSDKNRCLIFRVLLKEPKATVGQIADMLEISMPLASQHLRILLLAKLTRREKQGKLVYYSINYDEPIAIALKQSIELI